ncbi:B12-binding domain-containing radical SAM protein [Geomonas limicola]|uniref:B12-binding domain-containing radical SAM protein n=1 Tax=Geomonas limicola TaxID=2740186 RepID=A0A6V8N391_9BACT|nr:tetratricopeptide repeat protein [Geomonas limicola]GFO66976.1 B12-binding domain-containing radical SAM protein [Geomonas limicola]
MKTNINKYNEPTLEEISSLIGLLRRNRYNEAEIAAINYTERYPKHGFSWKVLGTVLKIQGYTEESLIPMQKAALFLPNDPDVHSNLGVTLFELGRLNDAEASYRRAIKLNPEYINAHINLGNTLRGKGFLTEAEACFRRALRINPDYAEGHSNLGNTLLDMGRLNEAEDCFRQAIKIKPDFAEAHSCLGHILRDSGRYMESEVCYRRTLEINPNYGNGNGYKNLGFILKELGRHDETLSCYKLALEANRCIIDVLHHLTSPMVLFEDMPFIANSKSIYETHQLLSTIKKQVRQIIRSKINKESSSKPKNQLPEDREHLRIALIYPPPWQIESSGDSHKMPFGPSHGNSLRDLDGDFRTITYGLMTIAAQAKRAGHEVNVYNLCSCPWQDIVTLISSTKADVFGISAFTGNRRGMAAIAALIRQLHPYAHITVGGPFATALPEETLEYYSDIDTVVIGEGEDTFMELLNFLVSGRQPIGIPGTAWRDGKDIIRGPQRPRIQDLDSLASPFDYFSSTIVMTSRGCPSKCSFCGGYATWGRKVSFLSAESSLATIKKALDRLPVPYLAIKDDTFTANRQRVISICDLIVENKLNFIWGCDSRVDCLDDEILKKMRFAGCQMISLGVESGSPEILKTMRKGTTPEKVLEVSRIAKKYGIYVRYYMILPNKGETPETLQQSIDLIKAGKPNEYVICSLGFYPGTEDWEVLCDSQGITPSIFFMNDFIELGVANNREKEFEQLMLQVQCDIGSIHGFDFSVYERESVIEQLPESHLAHLELANAYFRCSRMDEAINELDKADKLGFPIKNIILNQRACISITQNKYDEALNYLEQAIQAYPHKIISNNLSVLNDWLNGNTNLQGIPILNDSILALDFNSVQSFAYSIDPLM